MIKKHKKRAAKVAPQFAPLKIKLVAIAKDEAAYLPEWIHHHVYFGFDDIEIYINNTQDNSLALLETLGELPAVSYHLADDLYQRAKGDFQTQVYDKAAKQAKKDGFSHVMFLDIDEFWTPADLTSSIHDFLSRQPECDVTLFNWAMHLDEDEFSTCYQHKLRLRNAPQVKYMLNLHSPYKSTGIHNAYGDKLVYRLADGEVHQFAADDKVRSRVAVEKETFPHDVFVIHRLYRSQLEYVSLLCRGRPNGDQIKNNRMGYYRDDTPSYIGTFPESALANYYQAYQAFLEKHQLQSLIDEAIEYVKQRYQNALVLFQSELSTQDKQALFRALDGIELSLPKTIRANLIASQSSASKSSANQAAEPSEKKKSEASQHFANLVHASDFYAKKQNYQVALHIMQAAEHLRPNGQVIKERIALYKQKIAELEGGQ